MLPQEMVSLFAVYSRDSLSHRELEWLINLNIIPKVLLLSPLFSEWNLSCQQGVLKIVYEEPYSSQLKGSIPNHWNISANKEP